LLILAQSGLSQTSPRAIRALNAVQDFNFDLIYAKTIIYLNCNYRYLFPVFTSPSFSPYRVARARWAIYALTRQTAGMQIAPI
jgi:hypothetical protein